ncbi:unnamed protein product [Zymoseptoria tritici ST99CH_1E4]|uniref:Phospholipase A2 domain-containing protein n=1 Tax=Zymoseptoria tritici ST99CH_1E4 TaxID=1276532 RepID=A0A2H1FWN2_ZYMTR|nr:unnamed protein product [Zymoseptoria tritici ST99CH_1E4]
MKFLEVLALTVLLSSPATASCVVDPDSKESIFHLVNKDLVPFVKRDNNLEQAEDKTGLPATKEDVPVFHFQKAQNAPQGVYDLILADDDAAKSQFVGRADDGSLVLTSASTGPSGQRVDGKNVATSIFTVDCKGNVGFSQESKTSSLTARSASSIGAMIAFNYDPQFMDDRLEKEASRRLLTKRDEAYRCPPGQGGHVKPGARDPTINGCGSEKYHHYVPEFNFGPCCDQHDFCFDDCGAPSLSSCNNTFGMCMEYACDSRYSSGIKKLLRAPCRGAARIYLDYVSGSVGVYYFNKYTQERCYCSPL